MATTSRRRTGTTVKIDPATGIVASADVTAVLQDALSERDFTAAVVDLAHHCQWQCAHFYPLRRADGTWRTPVMGDGAGFPDLVLIRDDRLVVIELKSEKGRLEASQERWLALFRGVPGVEVAVFRPRDWDEVVALLR